MAISSPYLYTVVSAAVFDSTLDADVSNALNVRNLINRAARIVWTDVDIRSAKRKAVLSPNLFDDVYDYACPADLKQTAIVDLQDQANRSVSNRLQLVDEAYFDRHKTTSTNLITVSHDDHVRKVRVSMDVDDTALQIGPLDSLTEDGTWATFSAGSSGVVADTVNFVEGAASIRFNLESGTTTAGIVNSTLTAFDLTEYVNLGSVLVWAYIASTTNLTNFIIRIGSSASDYYTQTITTAHDGTAFQAGWNLLRFSFASMTETGTVADTAADYVALYMTKDTSKADDFYAFDDLQLHTGEPFNLVYYSSYPWQDTNASYIISSTADTDGLNCGPDELELVVLKAKELAALEMREMGLADRHKEQYKEDLKSYRRNNRSDRLKLQQKYW